jgi:hypothetical protein
LKIVTGDFGSYRVDLKLSHLVNCKLKDIIHLYISD